MAHWLGRGLWHKGVASTSFGSVFRLLVIHMLKTTAINVRKLPAVRITANER
eukprot:CAMPEP_0174371884 /NCGR_PEP_ID=MMETSP0811_2-20130205/101416_1 /TAXON_ID=73025 ORGANISM="Eutreptiella gymnastica-like, Strain CCMP1594" /NCGR_SAMPLE_ID=MMETSP0811_2 /ASSEMBLY_ACC=CAM_ASM_000667 /LENGTH=51 /DNA_ID=CAMNT_0015518715 /DNA_START=170 /DNA_END=325 /DNA_ORIENTATION=-